MTPMYRYFTYGKHLVCLDQSVASIFRRVSGPLRRAALKAALRDRLGLLPAGRVQEYPAFGHVGVRVHGGCKLFDVDRGEVTKVFAPGTPSALATAEIAAVKRASAVSAAPRFTAEGTDRAWYTEEYVDGVHATDAGFRAGKSLVDFYEDVESCLLDLVACEAPVSVDARQHISTLADAAFRNRWVAAGLDAESAAAIDDYVEQLRAGLRQLCTTEQLTLVQSHGDFSLVNAIATPRGLRFIDWEGIAPAGLYNDVFNFVFVERYYGRADRSFADDLDEYFRRYRNAVISRHPELASTANVDPAAARLQYYLERMHWLLNRDASSNLREVTLKSMQLFQAYDREAGDLPGVAA